MTRTRSGKTLTELLVMLVVLLGLAGMLAHAVQKVRAAATTPTAAAQRGSEASVSPKKGPYRALVP
jgi:hypothetical protein